MVRLWLELTIRPYQIFIFNLVSFDIVFCYGIFKFHLNFIAHWCIQHHNSSPGATFMSREKCYKWRNCDHWLAGKNLKLLFYTAEKCHLITWVWCWYSWDVFSHRQGFPACSILFWYYLHDKVSKNLKRGPGTGASGINQRVWVWMRILYASTSLSPFLKA